MWADAAAPAMSRSTSAGLAASSADVTGSLTLRKKSSPAPGVRTTSMRAVSDVTRNACGTPRGAKASPPSPTVRRLALQVRATTGIEAFAWLSDVAGLSHEEATALMRDSARTLVEAAIRAQKSPS